MGARAGAFGPLIVVTAIAALIVALMATVVNQPIDPGCFEFCSIGQDLALTALSLVSLIWLGVVLAMAWRLQRREPNLPVVSALAAALFVALMSGFDASLWASPSSFDSPVAVLDQLIVILAMGVQLPGIWRLAASAQWSSLGRAASIVAALATLLAAFGFVALGTTPFDSGPQVQFVAYLAFTGALAILAGGSWRRAERELPSLDRPGLALLGGAALFYAVVGAYYYISPLDSTAILLVAGPIMALGWLWIGLAWLRVPQPAASAPA